MVFMLESQERASERIAHDAKAELTSSDLLQNISLQNRNRKALHNDIQLFGLLK